MSSSDKGKVWVYRREEIPIGTSKETLRQSFPPEVREQIKVTSLSPGIKLDLQTLTATFSFNGRPKDEPLPSEDKNFYGFTPLYTPEGDIEADIIALTGLAGHAFGSWATSSHMWLRDFLPKDLPKARILLYGYDSSLAGNLSKNTFADFSRNFIHKFDTMRRLSGSENRLTIFIGHSLGCLIIKDALRPAPVQSPSQLPPIVAAVVFFGAPHRGLNITAMQSIMNGTASEELIRELGRQSSTVQRLNDDFRHQCEDLHILTIFEKRPTATLLRSDSGKLERTGPFEMMVEKDSAVLYWRREVAIGLDQDHSRIAKVDRGQNGCYHDIVNFMRQSISYASIGKGPQQTDSPQIVSAPQAGPAYRTGLLPLPIRGSNNHVQPQPQDVVYHERPGPSKALKPLFLVPFCRDPAFIDRVDTFNEINRRSEQHRRVALSGIGGVGKSQIAIEYCYRFREKYPNAHVVWVHASTKQRFDQAYGDIARKLELSGRDDANTDTLHLVLEWFHEIDGCWLMVLDNADDLDTFFPRPDSTATSSGALHLRDFLPQSSGGSMLITTRDERLGKRLASIHASILVNPMSPREARGLLGNWQSGPLESSEEEHSSDLLEALGYIPLAITQAAAFINENHITLAQYLEMFHTGDSDVQDLLDEDLGDIRRDCQSHNSIIKTWKISFDLIRNRKPRAAEMLSLMAFLDRQGIPESLLREESDRNVDVTTALGTLKAFSLIKAGGDGSVFELHRLVQLATRNWVGLQNTTAKWQEKALSVIADVFPYSEFENWTTCESLLPHAQTVIQYQNIRELCPEKYSDLLSAVASYDLGQGRYEMASVRYSDAVEIQKEIFGLDGEPTLCSMSNLALTYQEQGRYEKAEKLQVQVLDTCQRVLGAEYPDTLVSMSNLGYTYHVQGRYDEAEKLQVQALESRQRVLGVEHSATLFSINNLALIYYEQGRYDEAEKLQVQVLETRRRVLGAEYPDTLVSMNNLAGTYYKQDRYEEAEDLHLQALEARRRVLGADHLSTLKSMHHLASIYERMDRRSEAIALMRNVIDLSTKRLGADHPNTLASIYKLIVYYERADRRSEVITLMKSVVDLRTKRLGADHPDTLRSIHNLAVFYERVDRRSEAITLMKSVVDLRTKRLGADHPDTLRSIHNLAVFYERVDRRSEAITLMKSVIDLRTTRLGADHPDTLNSIYELAVYYERADRRSEAITLMESVVDLRTKRLGADHPDTLTSIHNLAVFYERANRRSEAITLMESVVDLRTTRLGADHPDTLRSIYSLAVFYERADRRSEAITLMESVVDLRTTRLGADHPDTMNSVEWLKRWLGDESSVWYIGSLRFTADAFPTLS